MNPNLVTSPRATLREALEAITKNGRQTVLVVEADGRLAGMVTDGDVRRALLRGVPLDGAVADIMNPTPVTAAPGLGRVAAVELMLARSIRHLPLVDAGRRLVDVLFLEEQIAAPPLPTPAVIMAGGEGRRLRPLTEATPKPLLDVGGRPLIEIMIERLRQSGIATVLIAVHHKADMLRDRLGDGSRLGVAIEYVEEPEPLGTMGALSLMRERLREPFFVVNGDILTKCDFHAMLEFHRSQAPAVMTVGVSIHQVDIPYGEFTLHGARVTRVEEKPRKEFPVNAGIYLLDPSAIDLIPVGRYFDATNLIRALLDRGKTVAAYLIREYWLDVGRHPDLEKANRNVTEEKAYREILADALDGHGHTFYKRVEEWFTARVEQRNPGQAEQKKVEALNARRQAEAKLIEIDQFLADKVNRNAASYFRRTKPNEPYADPHIDVIEDGLAINRMRYRVKRLDEVAARVRDGEEPIKWPLA